jgi:hypothetical protein
MAFTKAQLEALKNSQLASNQPITAATHRAFVQNIINELYDAQSRANLLAGVQSSTSNVSGDVTVVIRGGQAYLIPTANLVAAGLTFDDLNGVVIVDPQNGELLAYNATTDTWENVPNIYIPYAGATANVTLGEFGLTAGFIKLDTTPTGTPTDPGTMSWDVDNETVDVVLNGYTMKIGEDLFYPVKNQTGTTIPKGAAVRFAGTVGSSGRLLIALYLADGSVPANQFMGVTAEAIADGENGKVLWFGRLRGLNTNAFNEGDILYASSTVAGGFQTTEPAPPGTVITVAAVIKKSITQGVLFVRPIIEAGSGFVTIATNQTITGRKTFFNALLTQQGSNPVFVQQTFDNTATHNFRNAANEDTAGIVMDEPANEFAIVTRTANKDIRIEPHGTGRVKLPNVPFAALSGANDLFIRNSGGLARSSIFSFTPTLNLTGCTFTYTLNTGRVYRAGICAFIWLRFVFDVSGTPSGTQLLVQGLPLSGFTGILQRIAVLQFENAGLTEAQASGLSMQIGSGSTTGTIVATTGAATLPSMGSSRELIIQGIYFTD